jgi:hypothetical protein
MKYELKKFMVEMRSDRAWTQSSEHSKASLIMIPDGSETVQKVNDSETMNESGANRIVLPQLEGGTAR